MANPNILGVRRSKFGVVDELNLAIRMYETDFQSIYQMSFTNTDINAPQGISALYSQFEN